MEEMLSQFAFILYQNHLSSGAYREKHVKICISYNSFITTQGKQKRASEKRCMVRICRNLFSKSKNYQKQMVA